jgi:RimJ/RimL family protein N-acetyltransferase
MTDEPRIAFQPVQLSDAARIFAWRQRPHVARWWNIHPWELSDFNFEAFEAELRDELEIDWQSIFLITLDEHPIGFFQTYRAASAGEEWWPDEDTSTRGIDLFIGEESLLGQGLGPAIVRAFAARLFAEDDVQSIITDPDPENRRSVRCFEKAGFVAEREIVTPDGLSLLMRLRRESK